MKRILFILLLAMPFVGSGQNYNPSNLFLFSWSPSIDHTGFTYLLPPLNTYHNENIVTIKSYDLSYKDSILTGHVEYYYQKNNLIGYIPVLSKLTNFNECIYETENNNVSCEICFYKDGVGKDSQKQKTYFKYNEKNQIISKIEENSLYSNNHYSYKYSGDRIIDVFDVSYNNDQALHINYSNNNIVSYKLRWREEDELLCTTNRFGLVERIQQFQSQHPADGLYGEKTLVKDKYLYYDNQRRLIRAIEIHNQSDGTKTERLFVFSYK